VETPEGRAAKATLNGCQKLVAPKGIELKEGGAFRKIYHY